MGPQPLVLCKSYLIGRRARERRHRGRRRGVGAAAATRAAVMQPGPRHAVMVVLVYDDGGTQGLQLPGFACRAVTAVAPGSGALAAGWVPAWRLGAAGQLVGCLHGRLGGRQQRWWWTESWIWGDALPGKRAAQPGVRRC